ncbi:MAG TPA: NHL repeat-containing protein [Planctomycetota bacterium]|nr:NHL repeat-containing protein [Planctomycetota bacterium]
MKHGAKRRFGAFGLLVLAAVCALAGCERPRAVYKYEDTLPKDANEVPVTPLRYELVRTIDANVGDLRGIDVDRADRLYLVGSSGLHVLDAEGTERLRVAVPADANSVSVADDGTLWVGCPQAVLKFGVDGKPLGNIGTPGEDVGELTHVTSVLASGGSVFVADADPRQMCVHRFRTDGTFLNDVGRHAQDKKEFLGLVLPSPHLDMATDADGHLLVTNTGRLRVEVYDPDGGHPLRTWGTSGIAPDAFSGCCNPVSLALTPDGYVVTGEKGMFARVKVYDRDGKLLAYIPPSTFPGSPESMDLAVDSAGRIYVAYPVKDTVMVFERREAGKE